MFQNARSNMIDGEIRSICISPMIHDPEAGHYRASGAAVELSWAVSAVVVKSEKKAHHSKKSFDNTKFTFYIATPTLIVRLRINSFLPYLEDCRHPAEPHLATKRRKRASAIIPKQSRNRSTLMSSVAYKYTARP